MTRLVGLLARATSASMLPVDHTALDAAVWYAHIGVGIVVITNGLAGLDDRMLVLVDVRRAQTVPKHSSTLLNGT